MVAGAALEGDDGHGQSGGAGEGGVRGLEEGDVFRGGAGEEGAVEAGGDGEAGVVGEAAGLELLDDDLGGGGMLGEAALTASMRRAVRPMGERLGLRMARVSSGAAATARASRRRRAPRSATYPTWRAASRTAWRVAAEMPTLVSRLPRTSETVAWLVAARRAISRCVGRRGAWEAWSVTGT